MYNREQITWIDSGYSLRSDIWQNSEEILELVKMPKEVITIGFNIFENDTWICLAQSIHTDDVDGDVYRGGYFILKKTIIDRRELNG